MTFSNFFLIFIHKTNLSKNQAMTEFYNEINYETNYKKYTAPKLSIPHREDLFSYK